MREHRQARPACPAGASAEAISARSRQIFARCEESGLYLALAHLPAALFPPLGLPPETTVACLRSCLMKPEHRVWLDEIWSRLKRA